MVTIKSYTDLQQSKILTNILPLESADMVWKNGISDKYIQCFTPFVIDDYRSNVDFDYDVPCWSLAALLNIIQKTTPYKMEHFGDKKVQLVCFLGDKPWEMVINDFNNEVDICCEMILKLHKEDLL